MLKPIALLFSLYISSQIALAHFDPRAVDLPVPNGPGAILLEHRNYGLFDRPALIPINIDNSQQQDVAKAKRADTTVSADPVPTTYTPPIPLTSAPAMTATTTAPPTTTGADGYAAPTDLTYATDTDTYLLPSAYDSGQLSSLFAAESSFISEASTLLSAFPTGKSGIACTGVSDVSGGVVTVCGPTGDPRATRRVKSGAKRSVYISWAFTALGVVGGGVTFFL